MHPPKVLLGIIALATAAVGPASGAIAAPATPEPATRAEAYASAAARYGVPESILLAVSYLESRWDTNAGTPSTSGGYGPMHLTDVAGVRAARPRTARPHTGDARGDSRRPMPVVERPTATQSTGSSQTLPRAAALTGLDQASLRTNPRANIAGGAALLRAYQQELGGPVGTRTDPAAWFGAVARYSGADTADAAAAFADEVFATLDEGATRVTDDGQRVTLAATPTSPQRAQLDQLGLRKPSAGNVECPRGLGCEWIPAPYQLNGDGTVPGNYGNHDLSDRPARQTIEYIVIHDTEGTYAETLALVQDPTWVSWHYTLRSSDGHVAQHVPLKDVAWHAGNWYVNAKGIGLEHEGVAAEGTWYTEAMYRASAKLVRYLATKFDIPLDRQHILGHDNVPGITPPNVAGMHWDPGPYWDWAHYFDLLKAPFDRGPNRGNLVRVNPDFAANRPAFTGCVGASTNPCPSRGSTSVILHTAPSQTAPLLTDVGLHPDGSPSTMFISDHGSRVESGQTYAVAERRGDWTAIWYLGQKGWFFNPASAPTARRAAGLVATPKPGRTTIPVYGRAYPEEAAYPAGVPYQTIVPLQYTLAASQQYTVGMLARSEYYAATTFDGSNPGDWTVIRGDLVYVQIQFGHRVMYVNLADVDLRQA